MNREPSGNKSVLITGGTGLVGRLLTDALLYRGYQVSHLSRKAGYDPRVKTYLWDVGRSSIDENCIDQAGIVLHLAGAGIAGKRWTQKRKKELIESRSHSIALLYRLIKDRPNNVHTVISASATGYYGDCGDRLLTEESLPGNNFLADCCLAWEDAVSQGRQLGLRILEFRTGVVLDKRGGALPAMARPVRLGLGAALGKGKQWVSWIHWMDMVDMYLYGIENKGLSGIYNMVAPQPVTNKQLMRAIAQQLRRPLWPLRVPSLVFKILMGERSQLILGSARVSAQKIESDGFNFSYPDLTDALKEIYES
jgi:uncharacterized protein